jgi:hypothetical protein
VTPAQFLTFFPEFNQVDNASLIPAKLALAASRMGGPDVTVWGPFSTPTVPPAAPANPTIADLAQGYLAAHLLMTTPYGVSTLLTPKAADGPTSTAYLEAFQELETGLCIPVLVAGINITGPINSQ